MSRSDTAELVRLAFLDADIPLAEVTLDFFDHDGAKKFINAIWRSGSLRRNGRSTTSRWGLLRHSNAFEIAG